MPARPYLFGAFEVDLPRRELRRGGMRLELPAKAFDCLAYLIEHRDRVVSRDELISAVWGRHDVSDNLLAQCVLRVRRAIDDNGNVQMHVRTITGSGYRWVGELQDSNIGDDAQPLQTQASSMSPPQQQPVSANKTRPFVRHRSWLALAIAIGVAAALAFLLRNRLPSAPRAAAQSSLVLVLPATIHADSDAGWLRLGIMDLVAKRLNDVGVSTVPSESVVALTRAGDSSAPALDLDQLRSTTGAHMLMTAEVARAGTRWTVSLEAAPQDREPIRARGENADVFAAADAAVGQVITQLFFAEGVAHASATPLDALLRQSYAAFLADQYEEARRLIGASPEAMQQDPRVQLMLSRMDLIEGHHEAALASLTKLLEGGSARNDPVTEAKILTLIAGAYLRLDKLADSEKAASRAVDLLRQHPSPISATDLGAALTARATAHSAQDDVENALADFTAARLAIAGTGNVRLEATADVNYSALQIAHGRYTEAIEPLIRSADLFRRLRIPSNELTARMNLLTAYIYLQNFDAGAAEEPRIDELVARSADPNVSVIGRMMCAQSAIDRGSLAQAEAYIASIPRTDADVFARFEGEIAALDAQIALARGDARSAHEQAAKAVALRWSADEPRFQARAWWFLARADRQSTPDHGKATVARTRQWADKQTEPVAALYAGLVEAEYSAAAADPQAKARYEAALGAAMRLAAPIDLVAVTTSYAEWLTDRGDFARAREVLLRDEGWEAMSFPVQIAWVRLYDAVGDEPSWRAALARSTTLARERRVPEALSRFGAAVQPARTAR